MLTTIRYGTLIVALVLVLVGAAAVAPKVKPVAAATATPVAALLNADGTLRVDGAVTGALDLTGWDVALDPARGPVLRPATQTGTAGWEHLGVGPAVSALSSVVSSIVIDNSGKVYVGGLFVDAANIAAADYIARWDPVTQQWSALGSSSSGNGVLNRHVEALAIDGNGNLYVGGWFTDVAGIAEADYVARWNGTAWSALGSYGSGNGALSGAVFDIHVTASSVYVGGNFTDVAGIAAADYIARWDGTAWSALGSNGSGDGALNQPVNAITAQGNNLYVGGSFTNAAGIAAADYIARWDGTAWSALGSNGSGDGALSGFVHTVLATADTVYVGGTFTNAAGISAADYIAVWNGTQWLALGDNGSNDGAINAPVNKLAIAGNNLYVGGNFTDAGGQAAADYLAVWNGTSWTALGNHRAFNDIILDVVVDQNGNVYVGGYFSTTVGQPMAAFIAMWTGSNWEALGRGRSSALRGFVYALAIAPDGKVYVGGWFANAAGIAEADYVAMWEPATQTWSALGSNGSGNGALNDIVTALAIAPDGKVYVGGWFANAAGIAEADYVAMWEPATQTWSALGSNGSGNGALNDVVTALAIAPDGQVYVGGWFANAAGIAEANYVAMWEPATQTWSALGSNGSGDGALNGDVYALAIAPDGKVYVGGRFANAAGIAEADRVAMWEPATQTWSALGSNGSGDGALNDVVTALAIAPDGKVYVGGWFANAAGIAEADRVAMWEPATQTWSALGSNGSGNGALNGDVYALAIAPDGKVYAGGWFANAAGIAEADYVAMWEPATQTWSALGSNGSGDGALNGDVYALAIAPDGKVYMGGAFINAGNNPLADFVTAYRILPEYLVFVPTINR